MPVEMPKEEFVGVAKTYVANVLRGLCDDQALLAADSLPQTVRVVAKLSPNDFKTIKYSNLYQAIQDVVAGMGERYLDPNSKIPHTAEFKLYDTYFETLTFQPAWEGPGKGASAVRKSR
jgi:hypothetical protein